MHFFSQLGVQIYVHWKEKIMHGIFPSPQLCHFVKLFSLSQVHLSNLWFHAHETVRVCQQRLYRDKNFGYSQGQAPVMMNRIQSYISVSADIRVKYFGDESHFWWPHRIAVNNNLHVLSTHRIFQFCFLTKTWSIDR